MLFRSRDAFLAVAAVDDEGGLARRLGAMYRRWARTRRMHLTVLEESATPYRLVLAVSGFGAYAILRPEAGLHVLERPQADDHPAFVRARARVAVAPQPEEPPAGGPDAWRGQALTALEKEGDGGGVVVRRYREAPSPLVRDGVRGWRTGRIDRVFDGHFDVIG